MAKLLITQISTKILAIDNDLRVVPPRMLLTLNNKSLLVGFMMKHEDRKPLWGKFLSKTSCNL